MRLVLCLTRLASEGIFERLIASCLSTVKESWPFSFSGLLTSNSFSVPVYFGLGDFILLGFADELCSRYSSIIEHLAYFYWFLKDIVPWWSRLKFLLTSLSSPNIDIGYPLGCGEIFNTFSFLPSFLFISDTNFWDFYSYFSNYFFGYYGFKDYGFWGYGFKDDGFLDYCFSGYCSKDYCL